MPVAIVLLAVVAAVGIVLAIVARQRLAAQRQLTTAAEDRATHLSDELVTTNAAAEQMGRELAMAEQRAANFESERDDATQRSATLEAERDDASQRAATLEADRDDATQRSATLEAELDDASQRSTTLEAELDDATQRAATLEAELDTAHRAGAGVRSEQRSAIPSGGLDPHLLWVLEQARSERTWRQSVALGPQEASVFDHAADPFRAALQIELDAAREDVGAEVELDADTLTGITPAGCVLILRAAQELLAGIVRRGEVTTLHVRAEDADVVVTVTSVDELGAPLPPAPLPLPDSDGVAAVEHGVRIVGVRDGSHHDPAGAQP